MKMRYLSVPVMLLNVAIVVGVVLAIYFTKNPLCIIALMYLQDMPHYQLSTLGKDPNAAEEETGEYEGAGGFGFSDRDQKIISLKEYIMGFITYNIFTKHI